MTEGRIITVFGSAGRQDVAKRRLMAEYSAELADLTVLTAEDPRGEPLDAILAMMADGCRIVAGGRPTFWRIPDRGRAIFHALSLAQAGDLVLICGKGHEQRCAFSPPSIRGMIVRQREQPSTRISPKTHARSRIAHLYHDNVTI